MTVALAPAGCRAGVRPLLGQQDAAVTNATTADLLKFLIDRTGYIKLLEDEDTPEAFSRIENLRELVNAAADSRDRGETLDQFLDHAALIADADDYDERSEITLMSLHAAKGLEFPLVFLSGLEEGLFPHSRTMLQPDDVEEERRLCYVGMTRAMDQLVLNTRRLPSQVRYRSAEASVPSRFLEEVPIQLVEELGGRRQHCARVGTGAPARPAGRSPQSTTQMSTFLRRRRPERKLEVHVGRPPSAGRRGAARGCLHRTSQALQLHREHRRVLRQSRQEVQCPENSSRTTHRQARIPPRPEGPPSQVWGRHRLPAGRRRRRSQDYGKIPSLRIKKLVEKYAELERA